MSAVIQSRYKRTEIGEIPENWGVVRLGSVTQEGRHIRYGVVQPGKLTSNGCFMLRSQDYSKGWSDTDGMHRLSKQLEAQYKNAKLKAGDLVMTVVGAGIGQIEIIPDWLDGAILSRSTARIGIDSSKAEPAFVRYFLESPVAKRQILDCQKEGAQPVVSCPDLASFHIALPSKEEQINIANALTEADTLIRKLDQLIAKKRDIQYAAMQQLLTGQRRLPGLSGEWEVKRLGDVGDLISGGTPKTSNPEYWGGNIKWCTPTDITRSKGKYLSETERSISEAGLVDSGARLLPAGSLLICTRATIGELKIATAPICTNQGFKSLVCYDGISHEFMYYKLLTMKKDMVERAFGSTFLEISKANISEITLSVPPLAEQTAIATILSDMDTELAALEDRRDKNHQFKQGMMQELLTGRVRLA